MSDEMDKVQALQEEIDALKKELAAMKAEKEAHAVSYTHLTLPTSGMV